MGYYIGVGIAILVIAFFMAATQKARGYNFWKYYFISVIVLTSVYLMIENLVTKNR